MLIVIRSDLKFVVVPKSVNHRGSYYWQLQVWTYTIHCNTHSVSALFLHSSHDCTSVASREKFRNRFHLLLCFPPLHTLYFLSVIFNYFNTIYMIYLGASSVINTGIPSSCPVQPQLLNPLDTWISDQWCGARPVLKGVFAPLVLEWNWRREKEISLGVTFFKMLSGVKCCCPQEYICKDFGKMNEWIL